VSRADVGTRARQPDATGYATMADGLRLFWEVHGEGSTTIVLLPPCPISHSGIWRAQVHFLARHRRVVVYDGRGNGNSGCPDTSGLWRYDWYAADCIAIMDATGTERAVLAGICSDGVFPSIQVAVAPGVPLLSAPHPWRGAARGTWDDVFDEPVGWEKENRHYILSDHRGFLEFFFGEMFPEPHSEKHVEDAVAFGLDAPVETLVMEDEIGVSTREEVEAVCRQVRCPVLIVQGDRDHCQPAERGRALAELTGAEHVLLEGAGHIPIAREPVVVNRLIHEFAARFSPPAPRRWTTARARPPRALLVSSPIGLGHVWRDVAVARELRRAVPGLEVHWLAQAPVTRVLEACGETVHPASAALAPEAAGVDADAGEHRLHAFQMLRRLDEIFCANFMVFDDLVRAEHFDAWIADEAWELDYFLHENPELKTAPYVWMTDFVGVLPMPCGGEREAFLAADHNAQMVEHLARTPSLRDRSIFVGDAEDIVDAPLGPDLPRIRDWTEPRFGFSGYITGFDEPLDREALRAELGWGPDEKVCVVAAGGSAAGEDLLRRAVAAYPEAKERVPSLRMVVVAGPRLDPAALGNGTGVDTHGYVHQLYRHLAACDVAICHGGLSTTMELTAAGRPFLYFPLRDHFEQNHHVAHRLARHGAGRRMDYGRDGTSEIAAALEQELARTPRYQPVPTDGAARAAALIAELLPSS
jgi:UDP:flavonoid glycosyltransferase YjiC (YdhE family)/pimeloyl-ACP methyl ester carboxylesterase